MVIGMLTIATAITAAPVELSDVDQKALAMLGPSVTMTPTDAVIIEDGRTWLSTEPWTSTFIRTQGDKTGTTEVWSLEQTDRAAGMPIGATDGGWVLSRVGGYALHLDMRETGIHVPTAQNFKQSVVSRFNAPHPLVLSGQTPGEPVLSHSVVKVYDIHDPTVVAHNGELNYTWTDLGGYRLKMPAGTFDTRLIRMQLTGTVGPASVNETKWFFLAQGRGPVALIDGKDISAFLVYHDDEHYAAMLAPAPQGAPATPAE